MKFPWLIFALVVIPLVLAIWYMQHRRWQPLIDAANIRIEQLESELADAKRKPRLTNEPRRYHSGDRSNFGDIRP
jgi:F0F1-type ATP synthase membrane subunit b/b'